MSNNVIHFLDRFSSAMIQTQDGLRHFFRSSRFQPAEISFQSSKMYSIQLFRIYTQKLVFVPKDLH